MARSSPFSEGSLGHFRGKRPRDERPSSRPPRPCWMFLPATGGRRTRGLRPRLARRSLPHGDSSFSRFEWRPEWGWTREGVARCPARARRGLICLFIPPIFQVSLEDSAAGGGGGKGRPLPFRRARPDGGSAGGAGEAALPPCASGIASPFPWRGELREPRPLPLALTTAADLPPLPPGLRISRPAPLQKEAIRMTSVKCRDTLRGPPPRQGGQDPAVRQRVHDATVGKSFHFLSCHRSGSFPLDSWWSGFIPGSIGLGLGGARRAAPEQNEAGSRPRTAFVRPGRGLLGVRESFPLSGNRLYYSSQTYRA